MSDAPLPTNHDIGFAASPGTSYPSTFSTPLEFANPDSMLSGTLRGTQFVGSNTLQIDSTQNLITIKNSSAALNQTGVLRVGQVSSNYLGMAVNDGTVDTMFAGRDSSGNTAIKIAKPGFDAKTASNDQLIFNSNQNVFKVVSSLTATIPGSNLAAGVFTQNSVIVPHNLSSIPVVLAYGLVNQFFVVNGVLPVQTIRSYVSFPYDAAVGSLLDANVSKYSITVSVDATNVNFGYCYVATSSGSGGTGYNFPAVSVRYYLLQETTT